MKPLMFENRCLSQQWGPTSGSTVGENLDNFFYNILSRLNPSNHYKYYNGLKTHLN